MVRPIVGWTKRGDEYRIVGGKSYIKEDGCYNVTLSRVDGIYEFWAVPAKDLNIEELRCRLEGPLEVCKKGPFGRKFLEKYGTLKSQTDFGENDFEITAEILREVIRSPNLTPIRIMARTGVSYQFLKPLISEGLLEFENLRKKRRTLR